ncbi:nuclear pore complex protein Nup133 [Patella vulgata]|uniref:nuclear pore complex protein Nup133 n=1 Tax=Patella vulgata TaxID=6465 RepID=UPI0024A9E5A2|nr:nuclear pore complex protein Nup133 [Patella vulgata]
MQQAQAILTDLLPADTGSDESRGSEVDQLVVGLSRDVIDDYPASDPRWAKNLRHGEITGGSSSLIIIQQLKDKEKAHSYLIAFLKKLHIWERLTIVPEHGSYMSTTSLLCEHAEKLTAAIALRQLHSDHHTDIIDECIAHVFKMRRESMATLPVGLTPQDVFYRQVSKIEDIIEALVELESDTLEREQSPHKRVTLITAVNAVIEGMLTSALQYRQSKAETYTSPTMIGLQQEYIPWTSTGGARGLRTLLLKQINLTMGGAVPEIKDDDTRMVIFQQLLVLSDIILDGYSNQLESLRRSDGREDVYLLLDQKYQQERTNLISPFVEYEEYERAMSFAEKYYDFESLILVCEKTNNDERLQRYVDQFSEQGFSNFLFDWYMKHGRRGRLLSQPVGDSRELGQFLESENNKYLSWLHDINNQNFTQAHVTLLDLAKVETTFLSKKKTLLSISKLTALASDNKSPDMQERLHDINDELDLILHQEQLPLDAVQNLGMNVANMSVMTPQEIAELYVGDMNVVATEYDFKMALDLLSYIDDPEVDKNELRLHIWSRAVLRDSWDSNTTSDPLDTNKDTIFFKTVDLAYTQGEDLNECLPSVEELLESKELGDLRHNPNFQFLIKAGYEHLQSVM